MVEGKCSINLYTHDELLIMIINKPFERIVKFTEYHNGKKTDLFKIWFLDDTTQVRTSDNKIVLSSKIIYENDSHKIIKMEKKI
tara:strand:+ start:65 stop:316 length:252 start_codon:yes stop_codon:yes gene_type:complete